MSIYRVFIKNTDSCFFYGHSNSEKEAIERAKEAYDDKHNEEDGQDVEWSVDDATQAKATRIRK